MVDPDMPQWEVGMKMGLIEVLETSGALIDGTAMKGAPVATAPAERMGSAPSTLYGIQGAKVEQKPSNTLVIGATVTHYFLIGSVVRLFFQFTEAGRQSFDPLSENALGYGEG